VRDRIFSGANVEEALDAASRTLGVSRHALTYIVIDEGRDSSIGRAENVTRIAVFESVGLKPEPRMDALITEALRALTDASGVMLSVSVSPHENSLEISLDSDDEDFLWGVEGEVFNSLCLVLRRMVSRAGHRGAVRIINHNIIERRRERLEKRAREAAEQARREQAPRVLLGLSSFERRIVHLSLAGDEGIRTRSEGESDERRLIIEPVFPEKKEG
jgi:spoIIIJ-associated protein